MKKIGLFFGSTSDNTKMSSEFMKEYLENEDFSVDMFDIGDIDANKLLEYDNIIVGCPTWNIGELQDDWDSVFPDYEKLDFKGKIGAFYGCGDQMGYPDNFLDAVGILAKKFRDNGGTLIGTYPTDEYEFNESLCQEDDVLLGLGLDYDNEDEEFCEGQMIMWLEDIMEEFKK
ncbi:MAG: flavodoxin [Candidatus Neomarinimicrobiota bacterium]|jgi:flavodoxin I|nr:flavodoxin [Candidatus Neomarinimicrobiota bacterium]